MSSTTETKRSNALRRIGVFIVVALAAFGLLVLTSLAGLFDPSLSASVLLPVIAGGIAFFKA